jgi:hypothetical protein
MPIEPPELPPGSPGNPSEPPPENPPGNPRPEVPPPIREPGEPPRPDELPGNLPEEQPARGPGRPRFPPPQASRRPCPASNDVCAFHDGSPEFPMRSCRVPRNESSSTQEPAFEASEPTGVRPSHGRAWEGPLIQSSLPPCLVIGGIQSQADEALGPACDSSDGEAFCSGEYAFANRWAAQI